MKDLWMVLIYVEGGVSQLEELEDDGGRNEEKRRWLAFMALEIFWLCG